MKSSGLPPAALVSGPRFFRAAWGGPLLGLLVASSCVLAQRWRGWRESRVDESARSPREVGNHSTETPMWHNPESFESDVFTFARIQYDQGGRGGRGGWSTDTPDSDLNLSYRLQQMTSMKVDPNGRFLRLTDPELPNYPFIYIVEPGGLWLSQAERDALRTYLLNGGFLMLDDFWGENEWANVEEVLALVFPDRPFFELPLDHPLYHGVFSIQSKGQVPNIRLGIESEYSHVTWERSDAQVVHHRGINDDHGRLMVLATHNTDNGDGWEREGESDYYFHNFSEKISYPLGINVIYYVMTH